MSTPAVISVVDDDASVRSATKRLLRALGHVVYTFSSAEQFLASPYLNDTSCVIVDVQMSAMNGLELLATMRSRGHNVPAILVTASPDDRVHALALKAGAIFFLTKPLTARELTACLDAALAVRGS